MIHPTNYETEADQWEELKSAALMICCGLFAALALLVAGVVMITLWMMAS